MKVPEGGLFFTEELSAKRTIITGEVSSQGNDTKLVDIVVQQAGSHANSSPPDEWLNNIMNDGAESSSTAKIPKVPKIFRESNMDSYDPLVVSIGPYHHGKSGLEEMEKRKIEMAKKYVMETREKSIHTVYKKVEEVAAQAKEYYDFKSISPAIDDQSFTKMMFLDGCFVLQYIYSFVHGQQDMGMKTHHTAFVQRDLFLLENQLPYIVLKELMSTRFEGSDGKNNIKRFIRLNQVHYPPPKSWWIWLHDGINFIFSRKKRADQTAKLFTSNSSSTEDDGPLHLLDMMRKTLVGPKAKEALREPGGPDDNWSQRYQSVKELKTVGIWFRANKRSCYSDVSFSSTMFLYGKVTLPRLIIDDSTKSILLNMLAFETCDPDDYWITSYICFMDSLINNAEDVTALRSQNILLNYLGSDQEVADLFNGIAKYLVPNPRAYVDVKKGIKAHYKNSFKKWMAEWLDNHFSSPWTVLAFLGAIFALALSVIQTYAALNPPSN